MADILFGQSYYLGFDPKLWEAMQPYPPLGTMYAASLMRQHGFDVALFNAMLAESEAEWAQALDREKPRFAVLYEDNFNYLSKMCLSRMRDSAFVMLKAAKQRGCLTIVCGADASDHPTDYLAQGADFILRGEGEMTLLDLTQKLGGKADAPLSEIPGLAYMNGEQLTVTAPRPVIRDADSLPFPAWDLVDVEGYRRVWRERHGYYSMNMVTTRGCPYHCNWCAKPFWGQGYVSRSPENVVEEMKWLKEAYHPDHLWFADDIMGLKPGWWERFADLVEAHDARIPFKCLSRADLILRQATSVSALRRAGCEIVWIGAESGSQKILDAMEKGIIVEQIAAATQRLRQGGIRVGFFLQFGYPGETRTDIEATLQLVRDCAPDDIGMSVSYPLPGTRFYDNVRQQLGAKQNWIDSADLDMLHAGPFAAEFYRYLYTVLHKEFRANQTWRKILDKQRVSLRRMTAMLYHRISLPAARRKLDRLSRIPQRRLEPLPQAMPHEKAATPTAQED